MSKYTVDTLVKLATELKELSPYRFIKSSALLLQGVEVESDTEHVEVQWDLFDTVYQHFQDHIMSPIQKTNHQAQFTFIFEGLTIQVSCQFNVTVRTDPYHISVMVHNEEVWVHSLYAYLYKESQFESIIHEYLYTEQRLLTSQNQAAWNQDQYNALVERYGEPEKNAQKIAENPEWRLHPFYRHMGNVKGKNIVHLLGSNGIKGVALSLLGARVTVVDFSKENASYARALAEKAGVELNYIESDVYSLPLESLQDSADVVLMELGVLHYFIDLTPLIQIIKSVLRKGGVFLLHEFHPISTKLITSSGKKHKVTGNYFSPVIETSHVAFSKHMGDDQDTLVKVSQRKWTLGEVITTLGQEGLLIRTLEEEPNHKVHDIGLPKTYTIVAEKM
ncbi:class I SAM-dependent methyltransferase [Bacillus pinisoli]|uniref:class I SAM-dependent methyltransferase n=1 Tax=Bacillus pinisoli TaxID=2901866 RepID=UPI001FF2838A|nr:class I SAM-dependent methyltransferase [Bacillus pinisoli]